MSRLSYTRQSARDSVLIQYIKEITKFPILDRDTEIKLVYAGKDGDEDAKQRVIQGNLRYVVNRAKKFPTSDVDFVDLINAGNLGLMRAWKPYDPGRGLRYITYARFWIRQEMVNEIYEYPTVRVPVGRQIEANRIMRSTSALVQQGASESEAQSEVLEGRSAHRRETIEAVLATRKAVRIDAHTVGDTLRVDYTDPHDKVLASMLSSELEAIMRKRCTEREQRILRLYFGFGDEEGLAMEEIGAREGVSRERIRQLREKALEKLRHSRELRNYNQSLSANGWY